MESRDIIFHRPDGSQIAVVVWENGSVNVMERRHVSDVWSAPLRPTSDTNHKAEVKPVSTQYGTTYAVICSCGEFESFGHEYATTADQAHREHVKEGVDA